MLLENVIVHSADEYTLKVIINPYSVIVKYKDGRIINYDFSNAKVGIIYHVNRIKNQNIPELTTIQYGEIFYETAIYNLVVGIHGQGRYNEHYISGEPTYPIYFHLAEGETETSETATQTVVFPPPETVEQFFERIHARLLYLTKRIRALRHEEPHQNALSEDICREVPEDHEEVLRYDIACNLLKRPVGWLALQLENYQTRYNRHLEAVVKAKEAGRTPPTFNVGNDQTKIETMLEKLETNLTEYCLENHFDMHDHAEWDKIQNKQRKITLCADDFSPGELLVDVNSFFTDGRGRVAETHAKKTYHEISTKYWVKAKRTAHRNLVTERTVDIS